MATRGYGVIGANEPPKPILEDTVPFARQADLRRLAILLAVVVLIPTLVVIVLASRVVELGGVQSDSERSQAAADALREFDGLILNAISALGERIAQRVDAAIERADDIGNLAITDAAIKLATIYAPDGERLFPAAEGAFLTPRERQFARSSSGALAQAKSALMLGGTESSRPNDVWTMSASPAGLAPSRCWFGRGRAIACVVFARSAVVDAAIEALERGAAGRGSFGFALIDELEFQLWASVQGSHGVVLAARPLSAPLSAWRLNAWPLATTANKNSGWPIFAATVVVLLLIIAFLAAHIFRMQRSRLEASYRRAGEAAQISHELRTPLTNLRLYGDLIRAQASENVVIRSYCDILEAEAKRLGVLVEDATAVARGRPCAEPMLRPGNANDTLGETVRHYLPMLNGVGSQISMRLGADAPVFFDHAAFERIIINFLDNARKYAPGSDIEAETWIEDANLFIAVRDHGAGVPANMAEAIFDPLVRANQEPDGHGLGLAACRRLARANGGDVRVEHACPGARFVAWLKIGHRAE